MKKPGIHGKSGMKLLLKITVAGPAIWMAAAAGKSANVYRQSSRKESRESLTIY
jgi:hypothetical protein